MSPALWIGAMVCMVHSAGNPSASDLLNTHATYSRCSLYIPVWSRDLPCYSHQMALSIIEAVKKGDVVGRGTSGCGIDD